MKYNDKKVGILTKFKQGTSGTNYLIYEGQMVFNRHLEIKNISNILKCKLKLGDILFFDLFNMGKMYYAGNVEVVSIEDLNLEQLIKLIELLLNYKRVKKSIGKENDLNPNDMYNKLDSFFKEKLNSKYKIREIHEFIINSIHKAENYFYLLGDTLIDMYYKNMNLDDFSKTKGTIYEFIENFNKNDLKIAELWSNEKIEHNKSLSHNQVKMVCARLGEIIFQQYLKSLGHSVEDISITQIDGNNNDLWKKYDIKSDKLCIDVKTARHKSNTSLSEFIINKPNKYECEYISGLYIDMFDQLSIDENGRLSYKYLNHEPYYKILGVFVFKEFKNSINKLSESSLTKEIGLKLLDMKRIPFWAFSFSYLQTPREYCCHKNVLMHIHMHKKKHSKSFSLNEISKLIYYFGHEHFFKIYKDIFIKENKPYLFILEHVVSIFNDLNFTSIFLSLIYYWISAHSLGNGYYDSVMIRNMYQKIGDSGFFLGVIDVSNYIFMLIEMLDKIENNSKIKELNYFSNFYFNFDSMILRGIKDGRKYTIFTYCGGYKLVKKTSNSMRFPERCKEQFLNIGVNKTCETCHFLICSKCLTCDENCLAHKQRKMLNTFEHDIHSNMIKFKKYKLNKKELDNILSNSNYIYKNSTDVKNALLYRDEIASKTNCKKMLSFDLEGDDMILSLAEGSPVDLFINYLKKFMKSNAIMVANELIIKNVFDLNHDKMEKYFSSLGDLIQSILNNHQSDQYINIIYNNGIKIEYKLITRLDVFEFNVKKLMQETKRTHLTKKETEWLITSSLEDALNQFHQSLSNEVTLAKSMYKNINDLELDINQLTMASVRRLHFNIKNESKYIGARGLFLLGSLLNRNDGI